MVKLSNISPILVFYTFYQFSPHICLGKELLPVFYTLFHNLDLCNIQVLRDDRQISNIDWFNINRPTKILTEIKKSKSIFTNDFNPQPINVFKSRSFSPCKLAIILANQYLFIPRNPHRVLLDKYINTVLNGYMFYNDNHNRKELLGQDFVTLFVTAQSHQNKSSHVDFTLIEYSQIGILVLLDDGKFELCAWTNINWDKYAIFLQKDLSCREETIQHSANNIVDIYKTIPASLPPWCYNNLMQMQLVDVAYNNVTQSESNFGDSVTNYVLQLVFQAANETVLFQLNCAPAHSLLLFVRDGMEPHLSKLFPIKKNLVTLVITKNSGYEFLSCYRKEYITFKLYITPFKTWVWVSVVSSLTLIIGITTAYKYYGRLRSISFSPWMFILATLFEETGPIPVRIERNNFFRLVLGSWCLVSVVLTNCYNGIMISELNSPLPTYSPSNFDDLICDKMAPTDIPKLLNSIQYFTGRHENSSHPINPKENIFKSGYVRIAWYLKELVFFRSEGNNMPINALYQRTQELENQFTSNQCFSLLSLPNREVSGITSKLPELLDDLLSFVFNSGLIVTLTTAKTRFINLLDPRQIHFPRISDYRNSNQLIGQLAHEVEGELVECGKSAFIAKSDVLQSEFDFLKRHYPSRKFYKGKDIMGLVTSSWRFYYQGRSKVPMHVKALIETGVYPQVEKEETYNKNFRRKPVKKFKPDQPAPPIGLDGAVTTLFALCGVTVLAVCFTFIVEVRAMIYVLMKSMITRLHTFLRKNILYFKAA
ncbi:hypothetical protein Fcan01_22233 [Folsomia candida]|uniref:Uncharacterized protein n=1 Tax=Folsomia candida TaxID=158441 RepID=A0A226DDW6_FOLCA|nr:hypothetical protein Fcan01_22233 [Folsomia candida]